MFKSCCARSNKKINKSKSVNENLNVMSESVAIQTEQHSSDIVSEEHNDKKSLNDHRISLSEKELEKSTEQEMNMSENEELVNNEQNKIKESIGKTDSDQIDHRRDFVKKRYSVDYYKKGRMDIKRYSVDFRQDCATLEELSQLEQELAKTNVEVRLPGRRKSTGILKSTTSSNNDVADSKTTNIQEISSDDDEVFEGSTTVSGSNEGPKEPPATPIGRDELALRRHRFFSDLVCAARAAVEHRVRFDPLGPVIADSGGEAEQIASAFSPAAEFEALIERLERVASRLERLPVLRARTPTPPRSPAPSPATPAVSPPATPPPKSAVQEPAIDSDDMSVNGYQDLVQGPLRTYLELSQQIGGDVAAHANLVNAAFQAQLRYIQLATTRSKPSQGEEVQLLAPTSDQIAAIQQFREKNRASPYFNHLSAVSESIPALGWVAVAPTPAPYVKEMNDAGQFYSNRVLKEWKEKDKRHAEWCRAWVQLLTELQAYVKQHHTTGLVWSGKGAGAGAPPPPPPGGMPPPPPALPDVDFANLSVDDRSALFAEINKGEAITSSLRKVTSDMQTHKNPSLRQGPAPYKAAPAARAAAAPAKPLPAPGAGALPDRPPVFTRDGKKWLIVRVPEGQLQPGGGERGDEQRGVHVPVPRLGAHGARQDQRRRARLVHQVRRRLRQPRLQRRVRQLPVGANAGVGQGADYIDRQDGRVPNISVAGISGRGDRQLQVVGNECAPAETKWRLYGAANSGTVQDVSEQTAYQPQHHSRGEQGLSSEPWSSLTRERGSRAHL